MRSGRSLGTATVIGSDPALMALLREAGITLEVCPTSDLLTKALADEGEVRATFRAFVEHRMPFTIATDGPEMMRTHLRDEFELLLRIGALDEPEARAANERGHEASFIGRREAVPA
jgi:adenosine deaminase